jgi:hypothetical protein
MKLLLITFIVFNLPIFAWYLNGSYVIIEKGDNLWNISHSLLTKGNRYNEIWLLGYSDSRTKSPSLIYPGMKFKVPPFLFNTIPIPPSSIDSFEQKVLIQLHDVNRNFQYSNSLLSNANSHLNNIFSNTDLSLIQVLIGLLISALGGIFTLIAWEPIKNKFFS